MLRVALVLLGVLAGCAAESVNKAASGAAFAVAPPRDLKVAPAQTVTITVGLSQSPSATATVESATVASPAAKAAPAAPVATAAPAVTDNSLGNDANAPSHSGSGILPETGLPWSEHPGRSLLRRLAQLLAGLSFAVLVKAACMASNIAVQLSPYPQVKRWESRRCTGEADAAPYVSIAFGGWQWCFYGTFAFLLTNRSGFLILVHSNCLGAVLGTYYVFAFHRNCRHEASVSSLNRYLSGVAALALLQLCAMLSLPLERTLFLTGLVASFCSFLGALSMLVTVPVVLRLRDSRSIPGPLVCANLGSALVWVLCGLMLSDPLVTGPNVVSALSGALCLYLKYKFPSKEEPEGEGEAEDANLKLASLGMSKKMEAASEATPLMGCAKAAKGSAFSEPHEASPTAAGADGADGTGGTF